MSEKLIVIKTLQEFLALTEYLKDKEYVAVDTETTGVNEESKVIGLSISAELNVGYYVVFAYWDTESQSLIELETCQGARRFLIDLGMRCSLIMHNAIFDCNMLRNNFGVDVMPALHTDTMILAHLLNENRHNGLKELGVTFFGDDATTEQKLMKESVAKNGGQLTKAHYELYKADCDLIARYGAKDTILTLKLFWVLLEQLYEEGLDKFFYEDESMPMLKSATYDLNRYGLKVDTDKLQRLKGELEAECFKQKAFIYKEITPLVKDEYPGTNKKNTFNIGSSKQLSWLLFAKLEEPFSILTKEGRNVCKALGLKLPYTNVAKREFIYTVGLIKGEVYAEAGYNPKTKKATRPKKIGDAWNYLSSDKGSLKKYANKYKWVETYLEYNRNLKLLNTYVNGIQEKLQYGTIRPQFLQHGTTSGRYSSKQPNFQNLPRDDKRVKACIVARPGFVLVGADYSQLEPRVFASFSQDSRLMACFENGDDFYSVIGAEVFNTPRCSMKKDDKDSFAKKYPEYRTIAKTIALSVTYGTTAPKLSPVLDKSIQEAQEIIDNYFESFPSIKTLMLDSHTEAKKHGRVTNLYGRPRRMPEAKNIESVCGQTPHNELPYVFRNILNLSVNHRIQSTGASIVNRSAIAFKNACRLLAEEDILWRDVHLVLQVHDELVVEGPESLATDIVRVLQDAMENTVSLPGVKLVAEPKVAKNLADLK